MKDISRHQDLPVERFDHRNGLTSLQVHMTVISSDGRLWAATPAGLACFDGVKARVYGRKHGLKNHGLRTLAIHPGTDHLWIGTDLGVEVLDISGGIPTPIWSSPVGTVNALGLQKNMSIIGSSQGLFHQTSGQKFELISNLPEARDTIEKILAHSDGSFWIIGSGTGITHLSGDGFKRSLSQAYKFIGKPNVIAGGPGRSVLIGGAFGFCQLSADGELQAGHKLAAPVEAMHWDNDKIWIAFGQSVISVDSDLSRENHPQTHLQDVVVKHILGDRFDNIWLSTSGQALLKISNFRNTFVEDFPTDTGHILSIFSDRRGRHIGGSSGLVLPNGGVILKDLEIWDVLKDEDDKIWCATDNGLYCTPNPQLSFQYRPDDCPVILAPCRALSLFKNRLYIASIRGVARLTPFGAEEVLGPEGKSIGYVYSLHNGPDGYLWIATLGQGLFRYDGQSISRVELPDAPRNANIYALTHDRDGRIYLAHDSFISRREKDGSYQKLFESQSSVAAWSLGWMPGGNLVAGSSAGLIIFNDNTGQIKHRISGNFEDVPWEFTTSRSLAIIDQTTLYCGLGSGLRTVDLSDLMSKNEAPKARLAQVTWQGTDPKPDDDLIKVEFGKWRVIIEISTEWFLDTSQMRYRLSGFDDNWSEFEPMGPIHYTSLPIGSYTLEVELQSPLVGKGPVQRPISFEVFDAPKMNVA